MRRLAHGSSYSTGSPTKITLKVSPLLRLIVPLCDNMRSTSKRCPSVCATVSGSVYSGS